MFEDDIDIDEILGTSESANSLKRPSTDFYSENVNKKPKINSVTTPETKDTTKQTGVKKLFRFKKKVTLPEESLSDAKKLDVNEIVLSPIKEIPTEVSRNKAMNIVLPNANYKPTEHNKKLENVEVLRLTAGRDNVLGNTSGSVNCGSPNNDRNVEEDSVPRIQKDKNISKRRFPGPAGILPERSFSNSSLENFEDSCRIEPKDEICSQTPFGLLNEKPWEEMMAEFRTPDISLPEKYNIQWIKSRTVAKKLINQKTPFLAAFVDSIRSHSIQNPIVDLVLKDKSGTIRGTILHNLYEEHSSSLTIGSVLVLKDTGVLNTGHNDEPYLTITRNNLLSIYSNRKKSNDSSTQNFGQVFKTALQSISPEEIMNRINETKRLHKLTESKNDLLSTFSINKDVEGPRTLNKTFRKALRGEKISSFSETPNLSVLRAKSVDSTKENMNNIKENLKEKEKIDDIKDLFENQQDLDEFFNDEPAFCSTQKQTAVDKNEEVVETEKETCSDEKSRIFEDIFEGVDANALFDEF